MRERELERERERERETAHAAAAQRRHAFVALRVRRRACVWREIKKREKACAFVACAFVACAAAAGGSCLHAFGGQEKRKARKIVHSF